MQNKSQQTNTSHPFNTTSDPFGNPIGGTEGNAIWSIVNPDNYDAYEANPQDPEVAAALVSDLNRAISSLEELKSRIRLYTYVANADEVEVFSARNLSARAIDAFFG